MRCSIEDIDLVSSILTDDSVFPWIIDDGFDPLTKGKMAEILLSNPSIYVLSPNPYSVFVLTPRNAVTYDGHVNVLPAGRGKMALLAERAGISWMFENTPCQKIQGWTPAHYKHVLEYHIRVGFKEEGISRKSWLSGGKLYDEILFGIIKTDWMKGE